ncbi:unnamed protein product [Microthlaspi erraticum]|uniref:Uncharacterized protein n=1 Tax=Microthlaspi erraticum TaxID=1685480 RepID=A0A6D2KES5_9BRAS|nr:unnamed protein product [Microthlaspi erraticum]
MQELTTTIMSRSFLPTTSPRLRLRPRSLVRMTVCMDQSLKEKMVVILGATGTGKSRLSVDLATRFSGEIINSDKIQVYNGLETATNQITIPERCGVPHHCWCFNKYSVLIINTDYRVIFLWACYNHVAHYSKEEAHLPEPNLNHDNLHLIGLRQNFREIHLSRHLLRLHRRLLRLHRRSPNSSQS